MDVARIAPSTVVSITPRRDELPTGRSEASPAPAAVLTRELEQLHAFVRGAVQHLPLRMFELELARPSALLLHGPHGSGKSHLLEGLSRSSEFPIFTTSGPALLSSSDGAELIRLFQLAQRKAPSVLIVDDLDIIVSTNDHAGVANRLLSILDAVSGSGSIESVAAAPAAETKSSGDSKAADAAPAAAAGAGRVCVIGAVTALEAVHVRFRRAGRFDRALAVPQLSLSQRAAMLEQLLTPLFFAGVPLSSVAAAAAGAEAKQEATKSSGDAKVSASADAAAQCAVSLADLDDSLRQQLAEDAAATAVADASRPVSTVVMAAAPVDGTAAGSKQTAPARDVRWALSLLLARLTPGYVARDLGRVCVDAYLNASLRGTAAASAATLPSASLATPALVDRFSGLGLSSGSSGGAGTSLAGVSAVAASAAAVSACWQDFARAVQSTRASQRADFEMEAAPAGASSSQSRWEAIGGYDTLKKRLKLVARQWTRPETALRLGIRPVSGILLHGPSGCGKTLLVQALAADTGMNFIRVSGSDLFSKYFGDSERMVRKVFRQAAERAPCIIFFDEVDAIGAKRSLSDGDSAGGVESRVLSTLLNEMDGIEKKLGVYVVGATNRLAAVDSALIRPGRFDELVEVGLPDEASRLAILRVHTARTRLKEDVDLAAIAAAATAGYSGAELRALCREAALAALRQDLAADAVAAAHFAQLLVAPPAAEPSATAAAASAGAAAAAASAGAKEGPAVGDGKAAPAAGEAKSATGAVEEKPFVLAFASPESSAGGATPFVFSLPASADAGTGDGSSSGSGFTFNFGGGTAGAAAGGAAASAAPFAFHVGARGAGESEAERAAREAARAALEEEKRASRTTGGKAGWNR